MAKVLITGASGLLGASLALEAAKQHQVVGTYHQVPLVFRGVKMVPADLSDPDTGLSLLLAHEPEWVVNCAGATDVDRCEAEPDWARQLNVTAPTDLAQASVRLGARMVHISTDAVFDGQKRGYSESDIPRPINAYGRTKLEGERNVFEIQPEALILRTNFYGWGFGRKQSLAEWFLEQLELGQGCPGFTDVVFSPLFVDHLAGFILTLLDREVRGLLHLPGGTCLSKYEFGVRLAETFNLDPGLVRPGTSDQVDLAAPRPKLICLDPTRAEQALGQPLPEVDVGLHDFRQLRAVKRAIQDAQSAPEENVHEGD